MKYFFFFSACLMSTKDHKPMKVGSRKAVGLKTAGNRKGLLGLMNVCLF